MPTLPKGFHRGSTSWQPKHGLITITLDTFLLRQQLPAILPVRIALEKKSAKIWILNSSNRLLMRLANMDLEALAYTCLVSRSSIQGYLMLSRISKSAIKATLSFSPQMGRRSMTAWMTLPIQESHKSYGHGDQKQSLLKRQRRS